MRIRMGFNMGSFSCDHVLSDTGEVIESTLIMPFKVKEILNSNSLPKNDFFLSKLKKNLRKYASYYGARWHSDPFLSSINCEYVELLGQKKLAKARARKEMNKDKISKDDQLLVLKSIDDSFADSIDDFESILVDTVDDNFLYDKCVLSVGVSPPTKRLCDPPNYYPTVKPIVDGLTDSLWWKDDNFNHIKSTEFHYLPTIFKNYYTFKINIKKTL